MFFSLESKNSCKIFMSFIILGSFHQKRNIYKKSLTHLTKPSYNPPHKKGFHLKITLFRNSFKNTIPNSPKLELLYQVICKPRITCHLFLICWSKFFFISVQKFFHCKTNAFAKHEIFLFFYRRMKFCKIMSSVSVIDTARLKTLFMYEWFAINTNILLLLHMLVCLFMSGGFLVSRWLATIKSCLMPAGDWNTVMHSINIFCMVSTCVDRLEVKHKKGYGQIFSSKLIDWPRAFDILWYCLVSSSGDGIGVNYYKAFWWIFVFMKIKCVNHSSGGFLVLNM